MSCFYLKIKANSQELIKCFFLGHIRVHKLDSMKHTKHTVQIFKKK